MLCMLSTQRWRILYDLPMVFFLLAFGVEESPKYSRRGQLPGSLVDQPSRSADPVYLSTEMKGFIVWELRGSTMDY